MSILKVNQLQTVSGVDLFTNKSWINMNGTGTISIRGSGNIASIVDNASGDYTYNFSNSLGASTYAACGTTATAAEGLSWVETSRTTSAFRFRPKTQGIAFGTDTVQNDFSFII